MKSALAGVVWIGLAASTGSGLLFAQMQDNSEKTMTCDNGGNDGDRARHCEIREQMAPSAGRLNLDASRNGGVTVKGWSQSGVLVRARIDTAADTESAATLMASQVAVENSGGTVRAIGPESGENSWWSVSYEVFVPQNTDLNLKTRNGGMTISDVRGQIQFDVTNGGVHLKRVAGDVSGSSVNGGIQVELAGSAWEGRQLEVSTRNGGVTVVMPSSYSAHIQAETESGRIQSDFQVPALPEGNVRPRRLDYNVGSGGALVHVSTRNGSVRIKRSDTQ